MNPIIIIGGLVLLLLIAGIVVLVIVSRSRSGGVVQSRMEEYVNRAAPMTLEELEMSQPFTDRVVIPILQGISKSMARFAPKQAMEKARRDLELAGRPVRSPEVFTGIRGGLAIVLAVLVVLITIIMKQTFSLTVLFGVVGAAIGYVLPGVWLGNKIKQRQDEIVKSLPDALDLLVICVEAGLGFEAAMAKVAEKWDNQLAQAFARALQEIRLGKLRTEALREMEKNMDVADVTSFVAAIIQAMQFGVSIAKVLRIQSEQMRIKRRQRAEKKAHEAPIKMLFPMVFLIFPSLFIVLLGPAVLQVMDSGVMGTF